MNRQQNKRDPEPWYRQGAGIKEEYNQSRSDPVHSSFTRQGAEAEQFLRGLHSETISAGETSRPLHFRTPDAPIVEVIVPEGASLTVEQTFSDRLQVFRENAKWSEIDGSPVSANANVAPSDVAIAARFTAEGGDVEVLVRG